MAEKASKAETEARWRARIDRVLAALQGRLDGDEPLDMASLAEIACLSPHHFHRVYRAMTGETPADTVRRLRLHRAAGDLLNTDLAIAEIASRARYSGAEAFTRAFADAFGAPPAQFRAAQREVPAPRQNMENRMTPETAPVVEVRDLPEIALIATPHHGRYDQIGTAFERFGVWAGGAGLFGPGRAMAAVYFCDPDTTPEAELRSAAGLTVPADTPSPTDAPLPLEKIILIGGPHAVLLHKGPYAALKRSYNYLYGGWFGQSGRAPADAPSYEVYLNDPQTTPPAELLTEIRAPLAPQA